MDTDLWWLIIRDVKYRQILQSRDLPPYFSAMVVACFAWWAGDFPDCAVVLARVLTGALVHICSRFTKKHYTMKLFHLTAVFQTYVKTSATPPPTPIHTHVHICAHACVHTHIYNYFTGKFPTQLLPILNHSYNVHCGVSGKLAFYTSSQKLRLYQSKAASHLYRCHIQRKTLWSETYSVVRPSTAAAVFGRLILVGEALWAVRNDTGVDLRKKKVLLLR